MVLLKLELFNHLTLFEKQIESKQARPTYYSSYEIEYSYVIVNKINASMQFGFFYSVRISQTINPKVFYESFLIIFRYFHLELLNCISFSIITEYFALIVNTHYYQK